MSNLPTNEQIALWLDPERKRDGWWTVIGYTGPDFYAPGVCEEEVAPELEQQGCWWARQKTKGGEYETTVYRSSKTKHQTSEIIGRHAHHPTAINLALAKIKEATHA